MAQTANLNSKRLEACQIVTSFLTAENNNARTGADDNTPGSGFFIAPSTVALRGDVTGFALTAENEYGKLEWTDPNVFGESILLDDLSDVTITTPANGDLLMYNGTIWIDSDDITLTDLTATGAVQLGTAATSLLGFFGVTPVVRPAINTQSTTFVASGAVPVDGTATYNGYTIEGVVANLQDIGLLA